MVVKVGSAVVTNDEGINRTIIAQLAQQLLKKEKKINVDLFYIESCFFNCFS